jgi:hypothetical protein
MHASKTNGSLALRFPGLAAAAIPVKLHGTSIAPASGSAKPVPQRTVPHTREDERASSKGIPAHE